jgi:AraC family transcriptional regulator, transcriptional activator of pobA
MTTRHTRDSRGRQALTAPVPAFFLYGEPLQALDERLVHVETIAARSRLHDWNIRAHRHLDLHQILVLERGEVAAEVDGARGTLRAPAMVTIPPGTVHAFRFHPGAVGLVATFAPSFIQRADGEVSAFSGLLDHAMMQTLDAASVRATDLSALAAMLLREYGRSAPGRYAALRGLLSALLANVHRLVQTRGALRSSVTAPERELIAKFRRQIEARYREHWEVSAYAQNLSVSPQRLRRASLSVAGLSPMELVHQRVLIEAERQLRYTALPIAKIAYDLGFDDPAYFTRFFSSRMRVSPRQFRATDSATSAAPLPDREADRPESLAFRSAPSRAAP